MQGRDVGRQESVRRPVVPCIEQFGFKHAGNNTGPVRDQMVVHLDGNLRDTKRRVREEHGKDLKPDHKGP